MGALVGGVVSAIVTAENSEKITSAMIADPPNLAARINDAIEAQLREAGYEVVRVEAPRDKTLSVEQISQQWKQGSDLVAKGEAAKRDAQLKLDAASTQLKEGDSMIARGRTLMLESEQAFRDTSRRTANN